MEPDLYSESAHISSNAMHNLEKMKLISQHTLTSLGNILKGVTALRDVLKLGEEYEDDEFQTAAKEQWKMEYMKLTMILQNSNQYLSTTLYQMKSQLHENARTDDRFWQVATEMKVNMKEKIKKMDENGQKMI